MNPANICFLDLPAEIRGEIIRQGMFSVLDISPITSTSRQLYHDFYRHLQHLAPYLGEDDILVKPENLVTFPNLVVCDYIISISSIQDFVVLAQHPSLLRFILDLDDLVELYDEYAEDLTLEEFRSPEGVYIRNLEDAILFFLARYLSQPRNGFYLVINFSQTRLVIEEASVCVILWNEETFPLWNLHNFLGSLDRLMPLRVYKGPFPPPLRRLETFALIPNVTDLPSLQDQGLVQLLRQMPNLRRFGVSSLHPDVILALQEENLVTQLQSSRIILGNLEHYENHVKIRDLEAFHYSCPRVREVIINQKINPDDFIDLSRGLEYYREYRVLYRDLYRQLVFKGIPVRLDTSSRDFLDGTVCVY